jgi:hypothetical protein
MADAAEVTEAPKKNNNATKPGANASAASTPAANASEAKPAAANASKPAANASTPAANASKPAANASKAAAPPTEDPAITKFKGLLEALKTVVDGKADCKTLEKPVKDLIQAGEQNVKAAKNKGALKDADLLPLAKEIEKLIPFIGEACKPGANVKKVLPVTEEAPSSPPVETQGGGYKRKRKTRKQKTMKRKQKSRRRM